ncbi:MAG: efflux RND transporter periplasmic adaptor subunit [Thiobacillus sp.]|uniref:efflux RND transporter periplasmic adaptor subunit n=1 Tax=Thiobacillus sp. TaxID=924 RepID=UPI002894BEB6|nr:efflux RND transporter periplasmic adaptor subunit [Thiobacillus sp.]MDT3705367.1 efflux RND transporter periplasmic adaptor subunit [Thiobacillus sp.]
MRRYIVAVALAGLSLGGTSLSVAADKLELTTRVSGVVAEVLVKPGQRVKKGAVLLRLDTTVLQARLDEASAEEARARADEADAKRDMERAQELFNRTVSSTTELDAAVLRHARAQANLTVAAARRTIAQKNLDDAELRAPVDGVVNALPGGIGTVVTAECQPKTLVILSPGRP